MSIKESVKSKWMMLKMTLGIGRMMMSGPTERTEELVCGECGHHGTVKTWVSMPMIDGKIAQESPPEGMDTDMGEMWFVDDEKTRCSLCIEQDLPMMEDRDQRREYILRMREAKYRVR